MAATLVDGAVARWREEAGPRGAPVVVLLHMAGGGGGSWGPVASRLGRRARVLAPDFPGHGQSAPSPALAAPSEAPAGISPGVAALARWVLRWLDAMGVDQAVVAGHSMGGAVALGVAVLAPSRVAALGLVCTAADLALPPGFLALLREHYDDFIRLFPGAAAPRAAWPGAVRAQPIFPQAPREVVVADFEAVHGFSAGALLPRVGAPTVVVAGDSDTLTTPLQAERLAAGIPGAQLVVVPGGGHLLPREHAPAVTAALEGLLDRLAG